MQRRILWATWMLSMATACGSKVPSSTAPERASGQSALMNQTFAGSNTCDSASHDRPFIIEWDATDMSQFEALVADEIVFVEYRGCDLRIVDTCKPEVPGALGTYDVVTWTSGSVEKIDIANEGELYAKLPLGSATLGARVAGGERFHMEYYVSGTRDATRRAVYQADLAAISGCEGVTHFVFGYNLGAFALASLRNLGAEAGATVWGIGAQGKHNSTRNAEKRGGRLETCQGTSAREAETCKVPIRLTLRPITPGENPDGAARVAAETDASLNLAAKVDAKIEQNDTAMIELEAAIERNKAGDGKGCLQHLGKYDKLIRVANQRSTNPKYYYSQVRAQCVMLSGDCTSGASQLRKAIEAQQPGVYSPENLDGFVDLIAAKFCRGPKMPVRIQLLRTTEEMSQGAYHGPKKSPAECKQLWADYKVLRTKVEPRDGEDSTVIQAKSFSMQSTTAARCHGRAGDCKAAWEVFLEAKRAETGGMRGSEEDRRAEFANYVPMCAKK